MINCIKRHVVCIILDAKGNVIGSGRNQCDPPSVEGPTFTPQEALIGKYCARIHIKATEEGYDGAGCNSIHAEINAIKSMKPSEHKPYEAVLLGHNFPCMDCLRALGEAGVKWVNVNREDTGIAPLYLTPKFHS